VSSADALLPLGTYLADAMPTLIGGHPHAPAVLIAEKAAELIIAGASRAGARRAEIVQERVQAVT